MKMVARITNGIYIQKGFIDGSIRSRDFIAELFHLGFIVPFQTKFIGIESIQKSVDAMMTFSSDLKKYQNFEKVMNWFSSLERMVKDIIASNSSQELKGTDNFKTDINFLAKNGIDFEAAEKLKRALNSFAHENEKLTTNPNDLNIHVALGSFISIQGYIEQVITALNQVPLILPKVKFNTIKTAFGALQHVLLASKIVEKHSRYLKELQDITPVDEFFANSLITFSNLTESLSPVMFELENVRKFIYSHSIENHNLKYTHGLLEGAKDISNIFRDFQDRWIQSVIKEVKFSKSLEKLKGFGSSAAEIQNLLSSLEDKSAVQNIDKLLELSNAVNEISIKIQDADNSTSKVIECTKIIPNLINSANLNILMKTAEDIDTIMNEMNQFLIKLISLSEESDAVQMLEKTLTIVKKASEPSTVADVVKLYNENPDMKKLVTFIEETESLIQNFFSPIDKSKQLEDSVKKAKDKLKDLDDYQQMLEQYFKFIECLQNHSNSELLFSFTSKNKFVRELNTSDLEQVDGGMRAVKEISEVSKRLTDLEVSINNLKGYESLETDGLEVFENISCHSKVIGLATRGISLMKTMIGRPKMELNYDVILEQLNSVFPPLDLEDVENLKAVIALKIHLKEMYNSLVEFEESVREQSSSNLTDHFETFRNAERVVGIRGNLTGMIGSVEKLVEKANDSKGKVKLKKLKKDLEEINIAAVHFSEYKQEFKDSGDTLAALDLFFVKYSRIVATPKVQNTTTGSLNLSSTTEASKQSLHLEGYIGWPLFILVILASLGTLVYTVYFFKCKKKPKKRKKKSRRNPNRSDN